MAEGLHERLHAAVVRAAVQRKPTPHRALRAVIKHHEPVEFTHENERVPFCRACGKPAKDCSTIRTIAEALGVPIEGDDRGDR